MGRVSGEARPAPRLRLPLSLVVARYFVYVLAGALVFAGTPFLLLWVLLYSGFVLPANYGVNNLERTVAELRAADAFDAAELLASYAYAHLASDGLTVLETDLDSDGVVAAQRAVSGEKDGSGGQSADPYPSVYTAVQLGDGTWCVLATNLMPQWASRAMRASWPDPQTLFLVVALVNLTLVVAVVAWRASRVLTRKMAPLAAAADAVGAQDLDVVVGRSNVAQIDDVLVAMERMRASLKGSLEEQWAAEARQREQVAALAHDLKTPLTVMRGNAELLLGDAGSLTPDAKASAEAVFVAARQADAYVAELIAASRGQAAAVRTPVDVAAWVRGVAEEGERLAEACGLAWGADVALAGGETDAAPRPLWDVEALSRAVANLVSNACDHAAHAVTLTARVADGTLTIEVADDGAGFSPAALAHGRELFFTDDAARTSRAGRQHSGLGLALADEAARAHGGLLTLENAEQGGAVARLALPLRAAPAAR